MVVIKFVKRNDSSSCRENICLVEVSLKPVEGWSEGIEIEVKASKYYINL